MTVVDSQTFAGPGSRGRLPHRNLTDGVNHSIIQSEVEGGVYLPDLPVGSRVDFATRNHRYSLVHRGEGRAEISGHPSYCPEPVEVAIAGCNWGGTLLKESYVGRGMRLEFQHPVHQRVTTSPIIEIYQVRPLV